MRDYFSKVVSCASEFGTTNYLCLHLGEWVIICISESHKKERKEKEKRHWPQQQATQVLKLSPALPSPAVYFWERRRRGKARREREEWIKTRLCTRGSPAFNNIKRKEKTIDGRDIKCLCLFFYVFWLIAVFIDLSALRALHENVFAHWEYDLAAKRCPHLTRGQNDHIT